MECRREKRTLWDGVQLKNLCELLTSKIYIVGTHLWVSYLWIQSPTADQKHLEEKFQKVPKSKT